MNRTLKKALSFSMAARVVITLNLSVILFHILIIIKVIPYSIVWAGRLESEKEMYVFEALSIIVNFVLIVAVLVKTKNMKINSAPKVADVTLWIFVIVFSLNTLGNLTAKASIETYVATPLTFILTLLCWRLAIEKGEETNTRRGIAKSGI